MDLGLLRGLIAVLTLATFLAICWWAYRPGNRARFEEDSLLAFDPDEREQVLAKVEVRREGRQGGSR